MDDKELIKQLEDISLLFNDNLSTVKQAIAKGNEIIENHLDYIRICCKYILFDLEATKRENKYWRKIIESL